MPRYFLHLSFKGTEYAGWQIQENAISIQEKMNTALSMLNGSAIQTVGCGRTDTGVHAKQFYLHFDTTQEISDTVKFLYQLNSILPFDIAVHDIIPVADHRHARYDATERIYEYFLINIKDPFLNGYTYFTHPEPDIDLMNKACNHLLKQGDFSSFSKSNTQVKTNICHVTKASWERRKELLVFTIAADRFLRGMVRAVVGTLLETGFGRIPPDKIVDILASRDRREAGMSVPASGLYLSAIKYPFLDPVSINPFPA